MDVLSVAFGGGGISAVNIDDGTSDDDGGWGRGALLLETGDRLLLETDDTFILE